MKGCYRFNKTEDKSLVEGFGVACYKELTMATFEKRNASWVTFNTLCNEVGKGGFREPTKNMQMAKLDVYSMSKCEEIFKPM